MWSRPAWNLSINGLQRESTWEQIMIELYNSILAFVNVPMSSHWSHQVSAKFVLVSCQKMGRSYSHSFVL